MAGYEGLTFPIPLEQQAEYTALFYIEAATSQIEHQPPEIIAALCSSVNTATLHPSHEVVDATLDLLAQASQTDKEPGSDLHESILTGTMYAVDRPDHYGLDRALSIVDSIQELYHPGDTGSTDVLGFIKAIQAKAHVNAAETQVAEANKMLKRAERLLGTAENPDERVAKYLQVVSEDHEGYTDSAQITLAALQHAETEQERRQILAINVTTATDVGDLQSAWYSHHLNYPGDLPGGMLILDQLVDIDQFETSQEAATGYLAALDNTIHELVEVARNYQAGNEIEPA